VSVTKAGTGAGTVTSRLQYQSLNPPIPFPYAISCGDTCSEQFPEYFSLTLDAQPDAGSSFAGWSGDCSGTSSCSPLFYHGAAVSVTATFTRN
jgi:hypothetical protein